jgi:hypothetical protein
MVSGGLASKPAAMISRGLASKPAATVFSGLALKPVTTVFSSLASKMVRQFLPVWPQNRRTISWLSFNTKVVEGFLVWVSKSPRQFLGLGLKTR